MQVFCILSVDRPISKRLMANRSRQTTQNRNKRAGTGKYEKERVEYRAKRTTQRAGRLTSLLSPFHSILISIPTVIDSRIHFNFEIKVILMSLHNDPSTDISAFTPRTKLPSCDITNRGMT